MNLFIQNYIQYLRKPYPLILFEILIIQVKNHDALYPILNQHNLMRGLLSISVYLFQL